MLKNIIIIIIIHYFSNSLTFNHFRYLASETGPCKTSYVPILNHMYAQLNPNKIPKLTPSANRFMLLFAVDIDLHKFKHILSAPFNALFICA